MIRFSPTILLLVSATLAADPVCENCAASVQPAVHAGDVIKGPWIKGPWIPAKDRPVLFTADSTIEDSEGRKVSLDQPGNPLVISFIYTRCENEMKCPRMTAHLGGLGEKISASDLKGKAGVVLMTYDPKYDQSEVLSKYGKEKSFLSEKTKGTCRLVRCVDDHFKEHFEKWQLTVNFDRLDEVNVHGNQILVIDGQGRLARRYEILLPTHDDLLKDLQTLAAEVKPKALLD